MDVDLPPSEDVAQQDASNILYDLPYDSWVWGPHSGGWLAGWCLNMEHNCGLFMVMLFYIRDARCIDLTSKITPHPCSK
ncbi:hypothetical protein DY000_02046216 [Brassica cretica]|uniref:Uncharacterized protein n=1 Tax=Brassica cretica TaxID=69181 RepID=A0ABQ7EU96_BRACR|nr:hypothetical protein DY000_02046216 [Brassica cretica]